MSILASTRGLAILLPIGLMAATGCGTETDVGADASSASAASRDMSAAAEMLEPTGLPNPYMTHRDWGVLPEGREWGRVSGVYIDPNGENIWVFERCGGDNCVRSDDPTVLRFATDGTLLASFGADMFVRPHGMYVDQEGNVWVTDGRAAREAELQEAPDAAKRGNQVVKFSPDGKVLMVLGTPGTTGEPPEALNQPNDVIVAPNGEVLVSEGHSGQGPHGRISRFSSDGTFLGSFGEFGSGPGQFRIPHAMAFDSQGRLFVADRGNSRIQVFDEHYDFVDQWDQFGRPNDVFIDGNDVMYVLDSESGDERNPGMRRGVYIGSARDGSVQAFIPPHETDSPYGTIGEGVTVDAAGNIFVGEVSISGMTMFTPVSQVERTYGLGLPRDRDILFIPDSDYPDWPLRPDQLAYADVSGDRMKEWVQRFSEISLQSQAAGNMYWGRLPGTVYDAMTMDLMIDEFERLGLETERVPHTIRRDWSPTFWEASYSVRGRSVGLSTAFPVGQTAPTPPEGIMAEAVWVGVGAEPDFLGRDVEGKAVIIYSTFVPGGRSHSASDRAGIFGANTRASEFGAVMIINVMAVPGNAQFNPLGAPSADYGVPLITVSQDEGFALRDALGAGETVEISLKLDIKIRENIRTANVFARLPGASDEELVLAVHTDGFFQASMDNASGMASALEIARHYAAMPQDARPRALLFVLFPDHHHGETGLRAWERAYNWDNVAMALTLEHPSQTQLYWYNDDLMTSNTIGAFRWNAMGSPGFLDIVNETLRDFGVSTYTVMDGRPKLTSQAPGFHIIDHVIYHTTLDTPELVPAEGMERATRAFLSVIDQVNEMTLTELRAPTTL